MKNIIKNNLNESVEINRKMLDDNTLIESVQLATQTIISRFENGYKLLLCGNGGSAADAQHIASEFTGKYYTDREPLNAEALHTDTSYLTAVSNDYGYQDIFSRMIKAKATKGDILIALSTSGNSKNVVAALQKAKEMGVFTIGMTGQKKGDMIPYCDLHIAVPSNNTARTQEMHLLIGHSICEAVEAHFFII